VYCCTVDRGGGVLLVRRRGRVVFCGNSRHGQKGTVGNVVEEQDMPFTGDGLRPDLVMNPHAVPSRMTIGQLLETLLGTSCAALGVACGDATPFNGTTVADLAALMRAAGLQEHGDQVMYNPRTGEQVGCRCFVGPTYYQRLKHMTEDKVHSRAANGPVMLLTRQPTEGRARDGGLRLGEMELECRTSGSCRRRGPGRPSPRGHPPSSQTWRAGPPRWASW
jgi:DNA-directed RNA polymerase II subunit RPB2